MTDHEELQRIFHRLIWIFPFCPDLVVHECTLIILCTLPALNKPENEGNQRDTVNAETVSRI